MQFWSNLALDMQPRSVLELACGTGRLAHLFLRENIDYTGLDIVPNFIKTAQNKLKNLPKSGSFICANIKKFDLNKKFDLIFIAFNSFLHLLTNKDIIECLSQVKLHMHQNTHFIIDIFIPNPLFLYKPKNYKSKVLEFFDSEKKETIYVEETNDYNPTTDINKINWFFSTNQKANYEIRTFSMRMLFPSTINQILIEQGFLINNQWGDYYKNKLTSDSKLQIYDLILNDK